MKVAVFGADGMLGHEVVRAVVGSGHEALAITRRVPTGPTALALANIPTVSGVDARQADSVIAAFADTSVDAVVNCIGIVKQRPEAHRALESIRVNSLFPHELLALCKVAGSRLIHISTDCVFSGRKGCYIETDIPDPVDLYGRTKLVGEVEDEAALTLRTSIIGLELVRCDSLVEWFLRQQGPIRGWNRAIYSGLTTFELARVLVGILVEFPQLHGLWHVSADPLDKHTLLGKLRDALNLTTQIEPDERVTIDRSLDCSRFRSATGWCPPTWDAMLAELAEAVQRRKAASGV